MEKEKQEEGQGKQEDLPFEDPNRRASVSDDLEKRFMEAESGKPDPLSIEEQEEDKDSEDDSKSNPGKDNKKPDSEPAPDSGKDAEPSPDSEGKKEEGKKEQTVPLPALLEERSKVKSRNLKIRDLEDQVKKLKDTLQQSEARKEQEELDDENLSDEERRIRIERRELEKAKSEAAERERQEAVRQQAEKHRQLLSTIDKELSDTGYPGFEKLSAYTWGRLTQAYNDGEYTEEEMKDQSTWKNYFKETIFPELKELMASVGGDSSKLSAKKNLKGIKDPGKKPHQESSKEEVGKPFNEADHLKVYLNEREKNRIR